MGKRKAVTIPSQLRKAIVEEYEAGTGSVRLSRKHDVSLHIVLKVLHEAKVIRPNKKRLTHEAVLEGIDKQEAQDVLSRMRSLGIDRKHLSLVVSIRQKPLIERIRLCTDHKAILSLKEKRIPVEDKMGLKKRRGDRIPGIRSRVSLPGHTVNFFIQQSRSIWPSLFGVSAKQYKRYWARELPVVFEPVKYTGEVKPHWKKAKEELGCAACYYGIPVGSLYIQKNGQPEHLKKNGECFVVIQSRRKKGGTK